MDGCKEILESFSIQRLTFLVCALTISRLMVGCVNIVQVLREYHGLFPSLFHALQAIGHRSRLTDKDLFPDGQGKAVIEAVSDGCNACGSSGSGA